MFSLFFFKQKTAYEMRISDWSSDVCSSDLLAVRAANRPATPAMSYGHHRWQVLAAFVNGVALMVLSVWILAEALMRLWHPAMVRGGAVMVIATIGLLVNVVALARKSTRLNSSN